MVGSALPQPLQLTGFIYDVETHGSLYATWAAPRCSWCVSQGETLPERDGCARETSARRRRRTRSHSHVSRSRCIRDAPAFDTRHSTGPSWTYSRFRDDDTPRRWRTPCARFSLLCTILPAAAATNVESPRNRGYFRDAAAHRNTIISREYP